MANFDSDFVAAAVVADVADVVADIVDVVEGYPAPCVRFCCHCALFAVLTVTSADVVILFIFVLIAFVFSFSVVDSKTAAMSTSLVLVTDI